MDDGLINELMKKMIENVPPGAEGSDFKILPSEYDVARTHYNMVNSSVFVPKTRLDLFPSRFETLNLKMTFFSLYQLWFCRYQSISGERKTLKRAQEFSFFFSLSKYHKIGYG